MKSTIWLSVAVATVLGVSSASAATVFNYTADGGVVKGEVVDHDLSGPEYDPTKLYSQRGTLMYQSQNFLYDWFPDYNGHTGDTKDVFTYGLAGSTWSFPTPPNGATEAAGLSWGSNYTSEGYGPFYLDTSARPVTSICIPQMGVMPPPPAPTCRT